MNNKKILYFVAEDWSFYSHRLPIARAARDNGFEVVVVARGNNHISKIEAEGFKFIHINLIRKSMNIFTELNTLKELIKILKSEQPDLSSPVYAFEYFDNTFVYLLKKRNVLKSYYNDLHGVAPEEFLYKAKYANSIISSIKFIAKYIISEMLDYKVFKNSVGFIYASKEMQQHFEKKYNFILKKKSVIIPYLLQEPLENNNIDILTRDVLSKYPKLSVSTVIAFAGSFKKLGGVPDLIRAFVRISTLYPDTVLMLIGDGETFSECQKMTNYYNVTERVFFIGRISYADLPVYFNFAQIIVCPDRYNPFSDMILHAKYYDALLSGKIVLLGSFEEVKNANRVREIAEIYNLNSSNSLEQKLIDCIENISTLTEKYKGNSEYIKKNYTYRSYLQNVNL